MAMSMANAVSPMNVLVDKDWPQELKNTISRKDTLEVPIKTSLSYGDNQMESMYLWIIISQKLHTEERKFSASTSCID